MNWGLCVNRCIYTVLGRTLANIKNTHKEMTLSYLSVKRTNQEVVFWVTNEAFVDFSLFSPSSLYRSRLWSFTIAPETHEAVVLSYSHTQQTLHKSTCSLKHWAVRCCLCRCLLCCVQQCKKKDLVKCNKPIEGVQELRTRILFHYNVSHVFHISSSFMSI